MCDVSSDMSHSKCVILLCDAQKGGKQSQPNYEMLLLTEFSSILV